MAENPFPGMNPYLEQRWGDVHTRLIAYTGDMIADALPADLRARMQERVFIEAAEERVRVAFPDVMVYETGRRVWSPASAQENGGVAVADPIVLHIEGAEVREPYLEIIDARSGGRVVTMVEFISRSNKVAGQGRDQYLKKQSNCRDAGVNLVEVDLLRGGMPVTLAQPHFIKPSDRSIYHACSWRATQSLQLEYYPISFRDRLPKIRIPLRSTDPDVAMDLQELINLCYRRGRYDDIDYSEPLDPPLPESEAAWVNSISPKKAG